MERHELLALIGEIVRVLFIFSFGACVGSLINVLVYRMPRGLGVITPSSKCPGCDTKLAWNDNIPVLGWLLLRGRCRYCKIKISPEYVLVEAFTGLLFALIYILFFLVPQMSIGPAMWLGVDWGEVAPAWSGRGIERSWPMLLALFMLLGSLVAMTIVDAKTFMIPLVLAWVPTVIAVVVHPLWALWTSEVSRFRYPWEDGWSYAIASPGPAGWGWIGASIGGVLGIGASLVLLKLGLIKPSFGDYAEWETEARAKAGLPPLTDLDEAPSGPAPDALSGVPVEAQAELSENATQTGKPDPRSAPEPRFVHWQSLGGWLLGLTVLGLTGLLLSPMIGAPPAAGLALGLMAGAVVGAGLARIARGASGSSHEPIDDDEEQEFWLAYPHARREMVREVAFLAPCFLLAIVGWRVFSGLGGEVTIDAVTGVARAENPAPLWLDALAGALLGYLIAGGIVWGVRIFGTLAFGKEAMGLGDVHLLAAVGACLGWTAGALSFAIAVPVALYLELVLRTRWGGKRRAMPFGPALAVGAVLAILLRPWLADLVNVWLRLDPSRAITLP